jgi:hypothetical protein
MNARNTPSQIRRAASVHAVLHSAMSANPQPASLRGIPRRRMATLAFIAAATALGACNGVLSTPSQEAASGQLMMDMVDSYNQLRDQSAGMQDQLDSLREVVYQQDTVIRKLAAAAGVPVPPIR